MQTLFYALRPKLFPSKVFSFHTSSVTRLRRYSDDDKDDFELPMQGRPNRGRGPTQFSFFSIISRSAREARERRRDGVPAMADALHIGKVYDVEIRNILYAAQAFYHTTALATCVTGLSIMLGYSKLLENNSMGIEVDQVFSSGIFCLLMAHAVALGSAVRRCPLRVYFDKETTSYKFVFCHPIIPMKTRVIELPENSCVQVEPSGYNIFPWKNSLHRVESNGRKLIIFSQQFVAPVFYNNLLKNRK